VSNRQREKIIWPIMKMCDSLEHIGTILSFIQYPEQKQDFKYTGGTLDMGA
jgi:hypothetical protein